MKNPDADRTRLAMVTGAAGGIGRATVEAFRQAGWGVIALDRRQAADFHPGISFHQVDVAQPDAMDRLFARLASEQDRLDALVNNAAIQIGKPLIETTVEEWDSVQHSNLRAVYLASRLAFPLLQAARGSIINVSSVHAQATSVNIAGYAASKGGVLALTRAMALEFGPAGIRVNAVLPGAVDTEMLRSGLGRGHLAGGSVEEQLAALGSRTALGRIGRPEEIASAILFLADGQQSSFITGQGLVVDGGALARLGTE